MWRFGCLFTVAITLLTGAVAAGVWLAAAAVGIVPVEVPIRLGAVLVLLLELFAVLGFGRAVRRFASPVSDLIEAAGRIEAGDYAARVPERGPREVRSLARAFNTMTSRLETTDRERRAFLADISHELRTPLTVMQGQVEGVIDGIYPADREHLEPVIEEIRALEQLVEDLRTLALAESGGLSLDRVTVDPIVLLNETVAAFQTAAAAAGVSISAKVGNEVPAIEVDAARIRRVLGNLMTNAMRHTPAGGSVILAARPKGSGVEIEVRDTGEGIPPELLTHVFDRFVRGSSSTGSGLGLAIARDIVTAHGGTIEAESHQAAGTTLRIWLPG